MHSTYILLVIYHFFELLHTMVNQPSIEFIRNYETVNVEINFDDKNGAQAIQLSSSQVSVKFKAFGKDFQFSLQPDYTIISPSAKIFLHHEKITKMNTWNIPGSLNYAGTIEGENQSEVNGFFHDNVFVGRMRLNGENIYSEMASTYLKNDIYKGKMLIYKEKDVLVIGTHKLKHTKRFCKNRVLHKNSAELFDFLTSVESPRNINKERMIKVGNKLICDVELLADHTFVESMNRHRERIIAEMIYHMKVIDSVFRYIDLDGDLIPEGIGFSVEKITVIENENSPSYHLNKNFKDGETYLDTLDKTHKQSLCLVIAFCHRDFKGIGGQADLGGICRGSTEKETDSYNSVFVSSNLHGKTLPRLSCSKILLHEIGHAFGAIHDEDIPECKNMSRKLGKYIMLVYVAEDSEFNNWSFSSCSKKYIQKTIKNNGGCLKKKKPKCGNGITELGEECDCGPYESCWKLDPCCNPPGITNECTLKEHKAVSCSPHEGDCCNEDCKVIQKTENRQCFVSVPCRNYLATCNGISPFCPEVPLPDGTSCLNSSTCYFGHCISDVCQDHDLQSCKCPFNYECHICCLNNSGLCIPSQKFNFIQSNQQIYAKIPGTECHNNTGMCLKNGSCNIIVNKHRLSGYFGKIFWPFIIPIVIFLLLCITSFIFNSNKFRMILNKEK